MKINELSMYDCGLREWLALQERNPGMSLYHCILERFLILYQQCRILGHSLSVPHTRSCMRSQRSLVARRAKAAMFRMALWRPR